MEKESGVEERQPVSLETKGLEFGSGLWVSLMLKRRGSPFGVSSRRMSSEEFAEAYEETCVSEAS